MKLNPPHLLLKLPAVDPAEISVYKELIALLHNSLIIVEKLA